MSNVCASSPIWITHSTVIKERWSTFRCTFRHYISFHGNKEYREERVAENSKQNFYVQNRMHKCQWTYLIHAWVNDKPNIYICSPSCTSQTNSSGISIQWAKALCRFCLHKWHLTMHNQYVNLFLIRCSKTRWNQHISSMDRHYYKYQWRAKGMHHSPVYLIFHWSDRSVFIILPNRELSVYRTQPSFHIGLRMN